MRHTQSTILLMLLVMLLPALVQAQNQRNPFNRWDVNKDGQLTKAELPQQSANRFKQLDADRDGVATREEMDAHLERRNRNAATVRQPLNDSAGTPIDANSLKRSIPKEPTQGDVKYGG